MAAVRPPAFHKADKAGGIGMAVFASDVGFYPDGIRASDVWPVWHVACVACGLLSR